MIGFVSAAAVTARTFSGHALRSAARPAASKWIMAKSPAVPFLDAAPDLPTDVVGYVGFDPLSLSSYLNQEWCQAAEIKHGRVCMLACLGMMVQEFVHLPNAAFAKTNPFDAVNSVPVEGWMQILTVISLVELASFKRTYENGADLGFDPMGMNSAEMQLKEVKNGRLAIMACTGMLFQTLVFGDGPISQLSHLGSVYSLPSL